MIQYDYFCPQCKSYMELFSNIIDRHDQKCPFCGHKVEKQVTVGVPHIFKPYYDDAMDCPSPYIESEKQKKAELEKRGLEPKN